MDTNLKKRLITGLILASIAALILVLASYTCTGRWLLLSLVVIAVGMSSGEFSRICCFNRKNLLKSFVYFFSVFLGTLTTLYFISSQSLCQNDQADLFLLSTTAGLSGLIIGFFMACWYMIKSAKNSLDQAQNISADIYIGILFLGLGGVAATSLAIHPIGFKFFLWLILVVAAGDSAAYFVGSYLKGPKLSPLISPGKTWSGTFGGLFSGAVVGSIAASLLDLSLVEGLIVGAIIQAIAQIGDLIKSYIKRLHNVKDSGTILPGHGGVLDRIDGILSGAIALRFLVIPWYLNLSF